VLTKRKENQLLVFERKVLRMIYGPNIVDGVYRSRFNFELDREFKSPNVTGAKDRCRRPITKSRVWDHAGKEMKLKEDQTPGGRMA
jgi:hypothetical protein